MWKPYKVGGLSKGLWQPSWRQHGIKAAQSGCRQQSHLCCATAFSPLLISLGNGYGWAHWCPPPPAGIGHSRAAVSRRCCWDLYRPFLWVQLARFEHHICSKPFFTSTPQNQSKKLWLKHFFIFFHQWKGSIARDCEPLQRFYFCYWFYAWDALATLIISDSIRSQRENRKVNTATMSPG